MKAYSLDLRIRVLGAVATGMTKSEAARVFGVDRSTITRYAHLQARGDLAPKPIPGSTPRIGLAREPALRAQVAATPDATLAEHCRAWEHGQGARVSLATMSRALRRVGWTRKKRH